MNKNSKNSTSEFIMLLGYDFFDFGCSTGGNIKFIKSIIPEAKGLGIDIDHKKIDEAKSNGQDAITFDILSIPDVKSVEFVTMSHFLEHLPNVDSVDLFLK